MALNFLNRISRRSKLFSYLLIDLALVPISLYVAFALRYGSLDAQGVILAQGPLFAALTACGLGILLMFRLPWIKLSALEGRAMVRIAAAAGSLAMCAMVLSSGLWFDAARSVPLIFATIFFTASLAVRFALLVLVSVLTDLSTQRRPVVIYGAGSAGLQMAAVLRNSPDLRCVAFVDDNTHLQGVMMAGVPVYPPRKLVQFSQRSQKPLVMVAMPSVPKSRQTAIVTDTRALGLEVRIMPSYTDMISARAGATDLIPVPPDAVLGRDRVDLDIPEIARAYAGRTVLVTGAGGAIGTELCRHLLECRPASIILYDQSEFALYQINLDMQARCASLRIPVIARLGSVTDRVRLESVMREFKIEIVLHAAAYKHVPLVEDNELEGARNNVLGTQIVAEVAQALRVERFILVSTDSAARPTTIMGATKRMAELVVQDLSTRAQSTRFAMVRFGNVLGSSGSVLPLLQRQIAEGGPVTVTHPDLTRRFMTLPEAARLVLLAGAYAEGGDVFVLDMGEPRKIIDIARQMILLSGRTVKDRVTGEGDIEIRVTGLRPGEKLHEEVRTSDAALRPTPHGKILRALEPHLSQIEVAAMLRDVVASIQSANPDRLRTLVARSVEGYRRPDQASPPASAVPAADKATQPGSTIALV